MKLLIMILIATCLSVYQPAFAADETSYTCPMHPHYISTDPEGICPICGMDLVPVRSESGIETTTSDTSIEISVSSEMIQLMGVRMASVKYTAFGKLVRAYGNVQANTRREVVSASRLEGWIADLAVTAEGDLVQSGQLLYKVYSPQLIAAQKDYLAALEGGNDKLVTASSQRLLSLGMQPLAISGLGKNQNLIEKVPVFAESSGIVQALEARNGAYVKPGNVILKLQSYADVWVIASVVEQDIMFIAKSLPVTLDFPSAPNAPAHGVVDYIYPTIDPVTRTLKVRIVVDNKAGYLRPGAFADISFSVDAGERLSIPREAILHDSDGAHAIISLGEGRFSSRKITTGITAHGQTEILSGLQSGEIVVVSGQFMLDSETNLREGFSKLSIRPTTLVVTPETPLSKLPLDEKDIALMDHFVDLALYFHEAKTDGYKVDPAFLNPALEAGDKLKNKFTNSQLVPLITKIQAAITDNSKSSSLSHRLSALMDALGPWLLNGMPDHYKSERIELFRDLDSGQTWLQEKPQESHSLSNPYGSGEVEMVPWPTRSSNTSHKTPPAVADPHAAHH